MNAVCVTGLYKFHYLCSIGLNEKFVIDPVN